MIRFIKNQWHLAGFATGCLVLFFAVQNRSVHAQPAIFSFENDLQSWTSVGATLTQSTFGATDGTKALLLDNLTSGYKGEVARTGNFGPTTPAALTDAFNAFALASSVIAGGGTPKLEFDLAWDFSSATSGFIQLGLVVNSSSYPLQTPNPGDYRDYGTGNFINGNSGFASWPSLGPEATTDGVTLNMTSATSAHISVPFSPDRVLSISDPSTFYYLSFQTNGGWTGTVDLAVDNIKFTGVPVFEEHTLFSWETADNPGTPGVNEQLEGWGPNPTVMPATQALSITSIGATQGTAALELDRTLLQNGFSWGSAFGLDANANPSVQPQIDDFVTRINNASQIAIDVTFTDQFPISPSYSGLALKFIDETGTEYQATSDNFDIVEAGSEYVTQTLVFDVADFDEYVAEPMEGQYIKNLAVDGLLEGTNTFVIQLGTGTDDGAVYQIDNFRLISEVGAESADFDNDGDVDGRDFLAWQRGNSPNPLSAGDLALWQDQYGGGPLAAVTTVPEPATLSLALVVGAMVLGRGVRCDFA